MCSRGSYQVTSREEGKAAQRDESYKSCVVTLLIFFFLCIILILASLPWKRNHINYSENVDDNLETAQRHHYQNEHYPNKRITSTTESIKDYSKGILTEPEESEEITSEFEQQKINVTNVTSSSNSSSEVEESVDVEIISKQGISTKYEKVVTDKVSYETSSTTDTNLLLKNVSSTESSTSSLAVEEYTKQNSNESEIYITQSSTSTNLNFVNRPTVSNIHETTTVSVIGFRSESEDNATVETTTDYLGTSATDSTTNIVKTTTTDSKIGTVESTTTDSAISTVKSTTTDSAISTVESTTNDSAISTVEMETTVPTSTVEITLSTSTVETTVPTSTVEITLSTSTVETTVSTSTVESSSTTGSPISTTSESQLHNEVCTTGECKNIASKMLFYMNHTIDPCEDFYEYACGSFETSPQVVEVDLRNAAYQRILREMRKEIHEGVSSLFTEYYDSCMQYKNIDFKERIQLARGVLDKIGKFHTTDSWAKNHTNFTELVAKLLLHNSALLFDVTPDLDEYSQKQFTLKVGPTTYDNPFDTEETEDPCYASGHEREQETVDLERLYKEYKTCKNDTEKFVKSVAEALTALGVFNELSNLYNITQYVQTTVINIDFEIVQKFFANYPSKDKIREAYLTKNYTNIPVTTLQENLNVINWTKLIKELTELEIKPEEHVQVYFYDALVQGLTSLKEFEARDPMQLNNALLGLYAHNLYRELVLSEHGDPKEYCLRIAANVLIPEASYLYISSFSNDELLHMNTTIHSLFEKLKGTLELKIKEAEWAAEGGRNAMIAKINNLKVITPNISYFTDSGSIYRMTRANEVKLSDNYLENSVTLMHRYRQLIYTGLRTNNPGQPEQIWTYYATPFQSKGLAIYGLNLVVIPFGVIDWSTKYDEASFDYIILATLGNVIAHQIAHHFDANGIYYWNGTRAEYSLLNDNDSTNSNFEDYIHCQRNDLYENPMSMTLSSTGQTVSYKISQLTLNERLSETMGLRLAYDTLDRLRSREEVHLPWLELDSDQLFYLTYAQMHCTKSPLTSSYISLYEDEQLPSRVRIFVSASSNGLLGKAWKCPNGSGIIPSYTCDVFPYLQSSERTKMIIMRK